MIVIFFPSNGFGRYKRACGTCPWHNIFSMWLVRLWWTEQSGGPSASGSSASICRTSCVSLQHCVAVTFSTTLIFVKVKVDQEIAQKRKSRQSPVNTIAALALLKVNNHTWTSQTNENIGWTFGLCDFFFVQADTGEKKKSYFLTHI